MKPGERRIPDVLLERYLLSLLEGEARERVEKLLAESEADRVRLDELRAESSAFLVSHPPGRLEAHVEEFLGSRRRHRWWGWALAAPVLVGLGVLCFVLVRPEPRRDEVEWGYKTENPLTLWVFRGDEQLDASSLIAPGDRLRFEIGSEVPGFLAVLGRDEAGRVHVYHSREGRESAAKPEGVTPLPEFVLGEVSGSEELYVIFSTSPFELAPVLRALEAGTPLEEALPSEVSVMGRVLRTRSEP